MPLLFYCIIIIIVSGDVRASSIYTTKDNDCVPVQADVAPDVAYAPRGGEIDPNSSSSSQQVDIALRVSPQQLGNKALERSVGASEIHVGQFSHNVNEQSLDVLGDEIALEDGATGCQ